ncbi:MAG: hypothetical protein JST14_17340 [Bacteroidetes bacterium]|nr:hypothetical protein [Bacteroidota bacterium]
MPIRRVKPLCLHFAITLSFILFLFSEAVAQNGSNSKLGDSIRRIDWADEVVEETAIALVITIDQMPEKGKKDARVKIARDELMTILKKCHAGRYDHSNYEGELMKLEKIEKKLGAVGKT